jgi:hypothetical protein
MTSQRYLHSTEQGAGRTEQLGIFPDYHSQSHSIDEKHWNKVSKEKFAEDELL